MTVKMGQVKIVTNMDDNNVRTKIYNVVEKTDGMYTETMTELVSMEGVYSDETGSYIVDSASELGQGYRVFPMVTADNKVTSYMGSANDIVTWLAPLAEVS